MINKYIFVSNYLNFILYLFLKNAMIRNYEEKKIRISYVIVFKTKHILLRNWQSDWNISSKLF